MSSDWPAVAVGAAAALVGTIAGSIVNAKMSLNSLKLQLKEERAKILVQLRHEKLLAILDKATQIYYFPSNYPKTNMEGWNPDSQIELLNLTTSLEQHMGVASFYSGVFRKLLNFRSAVRDAANPIVDAARKKDDAAFEKAIANWWLKVALANQELRDEISSALGA